MPRKKSDGMMMLQSDRRMEKSLYSVAKAMHDVIPIVFKKVLWIFAAWIGSVVWIYSASVVVVVVYDDRSNFFQRVVPIISAISQSGKRILKQQQQQLEEQPNTHQQQRLLFIITSMHEYDTGKRDTIVNYDRFSNTIVPVLRESVTSILNTQNYQVDVYLITHYRISESRYRQVWDALAGTGGIVGLEIWDDATPIGYALENGESFVRIEPISRGLARQHRYVIKDKFLYYDVFLNFEDDMLITGAHVDHYLQLTTQLQHLRNQAPNVLPESIASQIHHVWQAEQMYYGPMTSKALARTVPGFIRVEVPLEQFEPAPLKKFEKAIPVDFRYDDDAFHSPGTTTNKASIDPTICCQVSSATVNDHIPLLKPNSDLLFWETSIEALGVRVLPDINATWVLLLAGNNNEIWDDPNFVVGDYWSGRAGYFGKNYPRPDRRRGKYVNNQGMYHYYYALPLWHMRKTKLTTIIFPFCFVWFMYGVHRWLDGNTIANI
jgi:hypothetical protein